MAKRQTTELIRQQVIKATDNLLYHKGYNLMSFSDIAESANVPRGNIYYYFKTKDDVLAAVIKYRLQQMQQMLEDWNQTLATPLQRLKRYAQIAINEQENVIRYGCPMGSLNTELAKSQLDLQAISRQQLDMFKSWLSKQFQQLLPKENAEHLAQHLLVRTQGIAMMSQCYADEELVSREVGLINNWLDSLPTD
jgi:TetR/AcrR family transcriptional regulator, transcriptional repressor for nem operon